jgi:multidrug efflux system outer membrane protein
MIRSRDGLHSGWALLGVLALAGCAGLPQKPQAVQLPTAAPLSDLEHDGSTWPAPDWWRHYGDPTLDRLIDMALASSPTLATAHARFDSARQSVRIAGAQSGAHVDAVTDADRQRLSDNGVFSPHLLGFSAYNLYDLGLQASYTFDWWDKQKNTVQSAIDEAHAAQADRSAAALLLASSVADAYFGWQADQSRLALGRERERTVARLGSIGAARIHAELDAADEIERTDSDLADVRRQLAALEGSAQLHVVEIAALIGKPAGDLPTLTPKPLPAVAQGLPDDVKLDLIARRADITASRWRVEAAERTRDAARAEFYPDITVNALLGVQSVDIGSLLKYGSRVPQVGGAIHLPIFDAGRLRAQYGATGAAIDAAVTTYQETVVSAAREVATQAATRAQIAAERRQRLIEVDAAQRLTQSAAARVAQGVTDPRPELSATESWIEQRDALVQLDAAAVSSDIGLQRALGGGYSRNNETR